jgi:hypothetical protein
MKPSLGAVRQELQLLRHLLQSGLKVPPQDFRNWLRRQVAEHKAMVAARVTAQADAARAAKALRRDIQGLRLRVKAKRNRADRMKAEQDLRRREAQSLLRAVRVMVDAAA